MSPEETARKRVLNALTHSPFGPSGSKRWITCPGSALIQKDCGPNKFTDRGSAMHYVAERALVMPDEPVDSFVGTDIQIGGNAVPFDKEMAEGTQFYVDFVDTVISEYPTATFAVEESVSLAEYTEGTLYDYSDIYGTVDLLIDDMFGDLVVIDLKGGKGVSVPADTPQLKLYAVMAAGDMLLHYERVRCIIVQPFDMRGDTIKEIIYTPEELDTWMRQTVLPAVNNAKSDNPTFQPDEEACRWCSAKGKCTHQAKMAFAVACGEFEDFEDVDLNTPVSASMAVDVDSNSMASATMAQVLKWKPFIASWLEAVEVEATKRLLEGGVIPNYKLVRSVKHKHWKGGYDTENVLYKKLKLRKKDILKTTLKTPTQILKDLPKIRHKEVEFLIERPQGNPTVAPESDKRQAIDLAVDAAEEFESMFE